MIMSGKWHLGCRDEGCPTSRGFQHFYGTRGYIDSYYTIDVFTDDALHFIDTVRQDNVRSNQDKPFFLYLAYNAPHFPLHAKPEDIGKYRGRYRDGWQELRKVRYKRLVESGVLDDSWPLSPPDVPDWESLTDKQRDDMDFRMALFAAIVDRLDQNIGRVIDHLDEIGELANTLILFLSDNGGTKETGLLGIKGEANTVDNHDQWGHVGRQSRCADPGAVSDHHTPLAGDSDWSWSTNGCSHLFRCKYIIQSAADQ